MTEPGSLAATRRSLHAVAELLIAGPQYRSDKTIRLAPVPGGFAGVVSPVGVDGTDLVWPGGRAPMAGRSCADLAALAGIDAGLAEGLYKDSSGVPLDEQLEFDSTAARLMLDWLGTGDRALREFAPELTPVLWPEHFDLGIAVNDINYGVSPGDSFHERPYAYVSPWQPRTGVFWNAPFGAARGIDDVPTATAIAEFFAEGRAQAG